MWSVGVIMYVLLSGRPAFKSNEVEQQVKLGRYAPMQGKNWVGVPEEAKDLVRKLLHISAKERWSATQALSHPFIIGAGAYNSEPSAASAAAVAPVTAAAAAAGVASAWEETKQDGTEPSPKRRRR